MEEIGGLGTEGYRLRVICTLGRSVVVIPSANNSLSISTPSALAAEAEEIERIAAERNQRDKRR